MLLLFGVVSIALAIGIYWKSIWLIKPNNPLDLIGYVRVLLKCETVVKIKHWAISIVLLLLVAIGVLSVWIELFVIFPLLN
jgi:hypothetical protein